MASTGRSAPTRYLEVARELRDRLLSGRILPASRLPTQRELAREFGTTVMTVRQALALLAEEGLVRAHHGVGTFATDPGSFQDPIHLASFSEEMARQGIRVETRMLGHRTEPASDAVRQALGLEVGRPVCVIERVRTVADEPVIYQRSYLPPHLAALAGTYDPSVALYAFLRERAGLVATRSEEVVLPCALPAQAAQVLAVEPSSPGFFSARTTFDARSRPFLYDEAYIRGDRVQLQVYRSGMRERTFYRILPPPQGRQARGVPADNAVATSGR